MYGTVARLVLKPGMHERFMQLSQEIARQNIPGWAAEYLYQSDANPEECYVAIVFESEKAYRTNAASPAQAAHYRQLRALLATDPEWHDGQVIFAKPHGS